MYRRETTIEDVGLIAWVRDIPFDCIPQPFVDQLPEKHFDYQKFLAHAEWLSKVPWYWNLVGLDDQGIKAVCWGTWDPLEDEMRLMRISLHPSWWRIDGRIICSLIQELRIWASERHVETLAWSTHRWKALERKLRGEARVTEARVFLAH